MAWYFVKHRDDFYFLLFSLVAVVTAVMVAADMMTSKRSGRVTYSTHIEMPCGQVVLLTFFEQVSHRGM